MNYHFRDGVVHDKKRFKLSYVLVPCLLLVVSAAGLYVAAVYAAPSLPSAPFIGDQHPDATKEKVLATQPGSDGDRLYLPQINVNIPVETGDAGVLARGGWLSGQEGESVTVRALRFSVGLTPQETRAKSPFYWLENMAVGDQFYLDYHNVRYAYKVNRLYPATDAGQESAKVSSQPKLTLYGCDERGDSTGQVAVEAVRLGKVVDGKIELTSKAD